MAFSPKRGPQRGPQQTRKRLIQSAVVDGTLISIAWFAPLSTPAAHLVEPGLSAAWQQYYSGLSVPAIDTDFIGPLSEPVRSKKSVPWQQFFTTDWNAPTVVVTTTWDWITPLSEPRRVKQAVAWQQPFTTDWTAPFYFPTWNQPFSEPVRSKKAVPWQQPFTVDAAWTPVFQSHWHRPFSEPVRTKARAPYFEAFTTDWKWSAPSYLPNWHQPFSEPIRSKQSRIWQQIPFTFDWKYAPPSFVSNWLQPFSEPRRAKQAIIWQQPLSFVAPVTPAISDLRNYWYQPFSEPQRQRLFNASLQQSFTMDWQWTAPVVPTITYSFSITEIGDTGAFTFVANDLVIGANVTMTERWVDDLANVTTTEIPQYGANVTITERGTAMANVTITETD